MRRGVLPASLPSRASRRLRTRASANDSSRPNASRRTRPLSGLKAPAWAIRPVRSSGPGRPSPGVAPRRGCPPRQPPSFAPAHPAVQPRHRASPPERRGRPVLIERVFPVRQALRAGLEVLIGLRAHPAAPGAHRKHPAGQSRGTPLRYAGAVSYGGVTQTIWPPPNPTRFSR